MIQLIQWGLIFILYQLPALEMFLQESTEYWSQEHILCIRKSMPTEIFMQPCWSDKGSNVKNGPSLGALLLHWYCRIFQTEECYRWIKRYLKWKAGYKSSCPSHCPGRFSLTRYRICNTCKNVKKEICFTSVTSFRE